MATEASDINIGPEAVFEELTQQIAQQALQLAAERAGRKEVARQLDEAKATIDIIVAKLPPEVAEEVKSNGQEVKPNRSQRRAKGADRKP